MKADPLKQHALNEAAERRLRRLQERFRAAHRWRPDLCAIWRRLRYWMLPALLGICAGWGALGFYDLSRSFGSPVLAFRHLAAAPDCKAARAADLAPAQRGEPGYWPMHDRDNDGIACEPYRAR
jgi:hypothetical protein